MLGFFVSFCCFLWRQLLQTPAHVLPSTSVLCSVFLESLLISVTDPRSGFHVTPPPHESADSVSSFQPVGLKTCRVMLTVFFFWLFWFFFPTGFHRLKEEEDPAEEDMKSENEEEDSEEDAEVRAEPGSREALEPAALTKAQSRELRRWTRRDHGWFSDLLEA